jgi:hypothetical protein
MKATEIMHILFDKADNTLDNIPEKDRRLYGIAGSLVEAIASKDSRTIDEIVKAAMAAELSE